MLKKREEQSAIEASVALKSPHPLEPVRASSTLTASRQFNAVDGNLYTGSHR